MYKFVKPYDQIFYLIYPIEAYIKAVPHNSQKKTFLLVLVCANSYLKYDNVICLAMILLLYSAFLTTVWCCFKICILFFFILFDSSYLALSRKTRYRRVKKQTQKMNMMFALSNLYMANKKTKLA